MVLEEEREKILAKLSTSQQLRLILNTETTRFPKTAEASTKARKLANLIYVKKQHTAQEHDKILTLYTNSVAVAPLGSEEIALAYSNRSAFLLHLKKYKECLVDIERALDVVSLLKTVSSLEDKLIQRRTKCLNHLELEEEQRVNDESAITLEVNSVD